MDRFIGIVLLLEFVLFDCLRLFFIFLTGEKSGISISFPLDKTLLADMQLKLIYVSTNC